MKTPKSFSDNLKKKIITEDMLGACIYSVNKRAKNFRDNINALYSDLDHVRALYGPTGIQYHQAFSITSIQTRDPILNNTRQAGPVGYVLSLKQGFMSLCLS